MGCMLWTSPKRWPSCGQAKGTLPHCLSADAWTTGHRRGRAVIAHDVHTLGLAALARLQRDEHGAGGVIAQAEVEARDRLGAVTDRTSLAVSRG